MIELEPELEAAPLELVATLPTTCADAAECVPPRDFARAACSDRFPGMAIVMFEKNTPWQRLYVKARELKPVNAYGGPATEELMEFGEEVLVLKTAPSTRSGQMQVTSAADIDVLRWDGTCVTARREMFATYRMPEVKNATIIWRYLDTAVQEALLKAKYVQVTYQRQRDACKSSSSTNPSEECSKATRKLNDAITVAVRGGLELPEPEKLPRVARPELAANP